MIDFATIHLHTMARVNAINQKIAALETQFGANWRYNPTAIAVAQEDQSLVALSLELAYLTQVLQQYNAIHRN